jgi:AAA-like domain/PD-(D/E)XK nuclease superfamily
MAKEFNVEGKCFPSQHYMADVSEKMRLSLELVGKGKYFIINRPRQYGKTTALYAIADALRKTGDYIVLNTSFEGVGDLFFSDEKNFSQELILLWERYNKARNPEWSEWLLAKSPTMNSLSNVSELITQLVEKTDKRVVLLIDEVDKSSNNQLFVSFLAMLRSKYLERDEFKTFHAVVLAGVHDVKSLKIKLRPDEEQKLNSPWNIAADFNVNMNLLVPEILPMLKEYAQDRNVTFDAQNIAEMLFFYTSGYPFLVSKICKIFDETILPTKTEKTWTVEDVEIAISLLLNENSPNFDTLAKNLENYPDLFAMAQSLVIEGETIPFNSLDPTINLGLLHGIFAKNGSLKIHNRIYNEIISNYMTTRLIKQRMGNPNAPVGGTFNLADGSLDMEKVLTRFQLLMQEEYSKHERDFLERNGRLVFLAFLKPILNGIGYTFKEPQISEERRLDIIITYLQSKYLVEMKIWRGEKAHQKGVMQLADYLDKQGLDQGYLVIFDHSAVKNWEKKRIRKAGKRILAIWV